jgi:hypothetical protein
MAKSFVGISPYIPFPTARAVQAVCVEIYSEPVCRLLRIGFSDGLVCLVEPPMSRVGLASHAVVVPWLGHRTNCSSSRMCRWSGSC